MMHARNHTAETRDNDARKYNYAFDDRMRGYVMRTFAPWLPEGRALELGCHHGGYTELLAERYGGHLTVVEASAECVAVARTKVEGDVRFITSLFEDVRLDGTFDAVFLIHTLEHLDAPVDVLSRVNRWLSPNGRLFLACPNANAASRQIAVKGGMISHNAAVTPGEFEHGHRMTYSLDTLEREARAAGLEVVARGGVFFKPLANFQFDKLMGSDVLSEEYMEGCFKLGQVYPDLCASVYVICEKGPA